MYAAKTSTILLKILDVPMHGLVDTGSEATFCSEEVRKEVSKNMSKPQIRSRKDLTLIDFSGTRKTEVKGEIRLPIVMGDINLYHRAFVIQGLNYNLILGKTLLTDLEPSWASRKVKLSSRYVV